MNDVSFSGRLQVAKDKHILNEFEAKVLNEEKMEKVVESRRGSHLPESFGMTFHCECDDQACTETISISTGEYQSVHSKTNSFIVNRSHVNFDLEEIVSSFPNFILVKKFLSPSKVAGHKQNV